MHTHLSQSSSNIRNRKPSPTATTPAVSNVTGIVGQSIQPQSSGKQISLPKRQHTYKELVSAVANGLVVAGTGLGLFSHMGTQIAGACCNAAGFAGNQISDYLKNEEVREKNRQLKGEFDSKQNSKVSGAAITLEPLRGCDRYGVNLTKFDKSINFLGTVLNTLMQLLSVGFIIWRIVNDNTNKGSSKEDIEWGTVMTALVFSSLAFIFDKYEQHIKRENLERYQRQLNEGLAELDKLPNAAQQPPNANIS